MRREIDVLISTKKLSTGLSPRLLRRPLTDTIELVRNLLSVMIMDLIMLDLFGSGNICNTTITLIRPKLFLMLP
jgi:hypothetical protein